MEPTKWQLFCMCVNATFTAPYESIKLSTRGLYPFRASWEYNPRVNERTFLIWSLRHCSGKSYMEEYLEGRKKGGTH